MDINDIFKESVTSTTLNVGKGKRKMGSAPSMRLLKERGYGIEGEGEVTEGSAKRPKPDDNNSDVSDIDDTEGGRFFSDGLTKQQKGVLQWVDNAEDIEEHLDKDTVRRLVARLERAMSKNTEDRIKYAQSPAEFAESEADLDEALRNLLPLTNSVQDLHVLDDLGALPTLVELLGHENEDIVMDIVELVSELTSMDAWSQEGESQEERQQVVGFIKALEKHAFFEALGHSLRRLDESTGSAYDSDDASGVAKMLDIVENLTTLDASLAETAVNSMRLLDWLQARICTSPDTSSRNIETTDVNQQYAAELIAILLQTSTKICQSAAKTPLMDALLKCLAKYRKRTPEDAVEMEYLENIINSLCVLVATPQGRHEFESLEGVELLVLLQKQPEIGRLLSLKILDYALSPSETALEQVGALDADLLVRRSIAKRYIEGMGLKYLFYVLMRRGKGAAQKLYRDHPESDERIMSCVSWLFRLTERESPLHWRVLAKFVPSLADDASWKLHVDRLVELNIQYFDSLREAEEQMNASDSEGEDKEEERYLVRQDAGLFSLQMSDIVIAFVAVDGEARERIEQRLRRKGRSLDMVVEELAEYISVKQASSLASLNPKGKAKATAGTTNLSNMLDSL
ncbi:Catenin-beta-like protein [Kickxella alabastrina]|uniref:Catenin-beta-like protein n=1 Tax=Kickxella alabastrina TaxID=61397 RepID=UPI00221F27EF|nr:Catenin-beta-like protein [Kickxella alabastrina]KAI7833013.1 Catenin-beta-like protein [Kickxella alabastrina]